MQITLKNYNKLLLEVQKTIAQTQQNVVKAVNREKVVMSWQVGKIIDEYLLKDDRAEYGQKLFVQLEQDIGINSRILYQMRSFYKTYPVLPQDENSLNWSHYRELISVPDEEKRKYFENLAIEDDLDSRALKQQISQEKLLLKSSKKVRSRKKIEVPQLNFTRGKLFTYKMIDDESESKSFVDCGFNIFTQVATSFKAQDGILQSVKKDEGFSLERSNVTKDQLHTYKAFVDKVVDGDTLNVTLDLGFKIRHKEILRLAKINAPEKDTKEGQKSSSALKRILAKVKFLVIKTNKTDIYGRYVADIFFLENETDVQKVSDEGIYLNQILLDKGLAEKF